MERNKEIEKLFGSSKEQNFLAWDTTGVPHPYCITPKHMLKDEMFLGKEQIIRAERENNAVCDICRKQVSKGNQPKILSYEEHETAVVVKCLKNPEKLKKHKNELQVFLKKLAKDIEKNHGNKYAGFVLMRSW